MRLDHLLSKEEEVGVVLLSSCQGAMQRKALWSSEQACIASGSMMAYGIGRLAEHELMRSISEGEGQERMAT